MENVKLRKMKKDEKKTIIYCHGNDFWNMSKLLCIRKDILFMYYGDFFACTVSCIKENAAESLNL